MLFNEEILFQSEPGIHCNSIKLDLYSETSKARLMFSSCRRTSFEVNCPGKSIVDESVAASLVEILVQEEGSYFFPCVKRIFSDPASELDSSLCDTTRRFNPHLYIYILDEKCPNGLCVCTPQHHHDRSLSLNCELDFSPYTFMVEC